METIIGGIDGAIFDMEDLNPGAKFDMEGGGAVWLRVCAGADLSEIRKKAVKKSVEYKKIDGQLQRITFEETNEDLLSQLIWDFCIVKWEKFFDASKTPIPCTTENKSKLMGRSIIFSKFVTESLRKLREDIEGKEEDEEKNL